MTYSFLYGKKNYVKIHTEKYDDFWCASFQYYHDSEYMGFNPLPKFGKYKTENDALISIIKRLRENMPYIPKGFNLWLSKIQQPCLF